MRGARAWREAFRAVGDASSALGRPAASAWPLLQATLGATLAWGVALHVAGHPDPFFAPVAAVVALNAPRGERGLQAVRLLAGVAVGIVVGEAAVLMLDAAVGGAAYGGVALASFAAMAIAHAAGGARITVIQAGVGAILTVVAADGQAGVHRLIDAGIGGGVALLFSQVLFTPEPLALLRRAQADALDGIAGGLSLTARALETGDAAEAGRALAALRAVRDRLGELACLRRASCNVARHSARWRSQAAPLVRERENADQLDLLGGACVMLARAAFAAAPPEHRALAEGVRELSDALGALAHDPGDRDARQAAADRAFRLARAAAGPTLAATLLRVAATDAMVYAGVDASEALAAVRGEAEDVVVPSLAPTPRAPFGLERRDARRPRPGSARELPDWATGDPDLDAEQ